MATDTWESALLAPVDEAVRRLTATAGELTQWQIGEPSLIPPWTRGHVLTHVARATDSLCRLLEGLRTGTDVPQYASMAARAAEIEDGARRPVAELTADITATAARFHASVAALPEEARRRSVRMRTGEARTAEGLVATRLRELEVHHVDLAAGYTFADIPRAAARAILDDIVDAHARREGTPPLRLTATDDDLTRQLGTGEGPVINGTLAALLAWLTGRDTEGTGLSRTGEDPLPPAPYWI